MAWNDLTIAQRSQLMNLFRKNGVSSLSEMRRLYDLTSPSTPLVEDTGISSKSVAPMYASGGKIPPQGMKDGTDVYGPPVSEALYAGPPVPYGFYDAPINWDDIEARQHYAETRFKRNQTSGPGAKGPYQIMPRTWNAYAPGGADINNYNDNKAVRDAIMDDLYNSTWAQKGYPSDSVRTAKALAAYNWGSGNLTKHLNSLKQQGTDVYHSMDWIDTLPSEPRNYVNFILRKKDGKGDWTTEDFEAALPHRFDAFPEAKHANGGNLFGPGGNILPAYPEIIRNAVKKKYLTDYVNYGRVYGYPNQLESIKHLKNFNWLGFLTSPYLRRENDESPAQMARRALLAKYTGIEDGLKFNVNDYVEESPYIPKNAENPDAKYYRLKDMGFGFSRRSLFDSVAGTYKIGHGVDEDGRKYVSYYDIWDLAPFGKKSGNEIPNTTPVELYDRFYEDEDPDYYYRVVSEERPEERKVTFVKLNNLVNDNRSGGKIHIKKKNRGKFTALKKRTGHSTSWFKAHGTPAQKKMAVFALNSRHWGKRKKHGGILF